MITDDDVEYDGIEYLTELRSAAQQISDDMAERDQINDIRESRRALMEAQVASDDIKSKLCDEIHKDKMSVGGLERKIRMLEFDSPDLFKYIRKLEFIQDGIWCSKCNVIKNIGVPRPKPTEEPHQPETNTTLTESVPTNRGNLSRPASNERSIHTEPNPTTAESVQLTTQREKSTTISTSEYKELLAEFSALKLLVDAQQSEARRINNTFRSIGDKLNAIVAEVDEYSVNHPSVCQLANVAKLSEDIHDQQSSLFNRPQHSIIDEKKLMELPMVSSDDLLG